MAHHLVTGAASGIGFLLSKTLLERGDHVWAADLQLEALDKLRPFAKQSSQLQCSALDVRDAQQWDNLVAQVQRTWPKLDTILNVAGVLRPEYVEGTSVDSVNLQIDVNTKGVIFGTQVAARLMVAQGHGHIVNIASTAGISPVPGCAVYCASKFAVRGYTLSVAQELRPKGVKVTVVCPDAVATPMLGPDNHRQEAAMIFSGGAPMSTDKVVAAIVKALRTAPLEVTLPAWRAALAKTASLAPALTSSAFGVMVWLGKRRLARTPGASKT